MTDATLAALVCSFVQVTLHARDAGPRCEVLRDALSGLQPDARAEFEELIREALEVGLVADPRPLAALVSTPGATCFGWRNAGLLPGRSES